ncbi:MAG: RagB/SusD family nutrient uptake outer membrane protein [Bacteroidetes bacterium]|nr:RagB/SusD family nutrient uptake outer membrane protein [Bacteroidota bacterium]MBS1540318.1 RagB/SusD family nutrient uptake outer membrane protein [Bacteroidota bacterium]
MKKINNINSKAILTFFVFGMGLFSCQTDMLSPVPQTALSDKVVFSSPARITQMVEGMYATVKSGNFLGGRYQIYNDIRADQFINRLTNGVTGLQTWNFTLVESTNEVNNLWNAAYAAVNQCNVFIKGMSDNASKFVQPTFPANYSSTATQYVAEAKLLRGLSYFCLLQLYAKPYIASGGADAGLPLRLQAETNSSNNGLARSTVAQVYAQIIADLDDAEAGLPTNYATALMNTTRAHVNTAIALKTRVKLAMTDYAGVITEANKIVPASAPYIATSGVANQLMSSFTTVFSPPQTTAESIFSMPFSSTDQPGTQNQLAYYYLPSSAGGNGEYTINAAGIVSDNVSFLPVDSRRAQIVTSGAAQYLTKYPTPNPWTDKAPVIRWSEVLLNLAEARARANAGVDAQSLALLNAVRTRSAGVGGALTPPDQATLIANIMTERTIEFLGEGLRSIDLMRTNSTIPGKGSVSSVAPSDPNYIWPIPSGELSANPLMTRN